MLQLLLLGLGQRGPLLWAVHTYDREREEGRSLPKKIKAEQIQLREKINMLTCRSRGRSTPPDPRGSWDAPDALWCPCAEMVYTGKQQGAWSHTTYLNFFLYILFKGKRLYLLHCCHRVGVAFHQPRHRPCLKACWDQRLQQEQQHKHTTFPDRQNEAFEGLAIRGVLTSIEQPMSEPLSRAFFMIL